MNFFNLKHKFEKRPLTSENESRLTLINKSLVQLERISDFQLETADGREGLKIALDLVFSYIESIEAGDEYEVVGTIRDRIRDTYEQLYSIKYHSETTTPDSVAFYTEIEEVMEMIEKRGERFVADMDIYKRFNEGSGQAA